ncbi:protein hairy-like [Nerophis lumbriciformis]|uniref:protein hairy-like n=1 Tax=Nerophis lumbriciformis TaxID=546530 RepID=UPI002ADF28F2|nr:transcription factor HES-7-like [Nerophis lumbriciformis]
MTRNFERNLQDDTKSRKRILKPAVEKKRRDRINNSLAELRSLLLTNTADPRLQNPKIEKAEILDLAVEYLHKWTEGKKLSNDVGSGAVSPPLITVEGAGFQQCVAQMASYMHKIPPAQRAHLMEGLKHHTEKQQQQQAYNAPSLNCIIRLPDAASAEAICTSESKDNSLLFVHSPPQPHACSTPLHTPPTSPWFSTSSPAFPSFACHFSFPPSLSPPSANTSFSSLPHSLHTLASASPTAFHYPPVTSLRSPPHPMQRSSALMWRPWF